MSDITAPTSRAPLPVDWSPTNLPRRPVDRLPSPPSRSGSAPPSLSAATVFSKETAGRLLAASIIVATPDRHRGRGRPDWPVILVGGGLLILVGAAVLA